MECTLFVSGINDARKIESFAIGTDATGMINAWEIVLWSYPDDPRHYILLSAVYRFQQTGDNSIFEGELPIGLR